MTIHHHYVPTLCCHTTLTSAKIIIMTNHHPPPLYSMFSSHVMMRLSSSELSCRQINSKYYSWSSQIWQNMVLMLLFMNIRELITSKHKRDFCCIRKAKQGRLLYIYFFILSLHLSYDQCYVKQTSCITIYSVSKLQIISFIASIISSRI